MSPRLRIALATALGAAASGCPGGPPDLPLPPDGGGGDAGLRIEWRSQPAVIPSGPSSGTAIAEARFRLDDLRVVGDAGPIDLDLRELSWRQGEAPAALPVMGASQGLYSRLRFELEGEDRGDDEYAYEIRGTVDAGGTVRPYTIRARSEISLSIDFAIALAAGGSATIPVRVELDRIVGAIDFGQVPIEDGRYLVEDGPQGEAARDAVRDAFGVGAP